MPESLTASSSAKVVHRQSELSRIFRDRSAMTGLLVISAIALSALFSDFLVPYDPDLQGDLLTSRYLPPSGTHLFGTDKFGRDVFSRVVQGGRVSLSIGFGVAVLTATLGLMLGTVAGYKGGAVDSIIMRLLDFLLAFPAVFLVLTLISVLDASDWALIPLLALTGWMESARLVRAEVLSLRDREFVLAARLLGLGDWRIIVNHIIPNAVTPLLVVTTLKVGEVILLESALSFLGVGIQPPTPSWGNIISDGRDVLLSAWWVATFPGLFLVLVSTSFSLVGEGLRRQLVGNQVG